jgi:hypothetical protein
MRGTPYHLFLTRVDGCGVCAFVDRKVQDGHFYPRIVLVRLCFDERAFDGTVVDGELVRLTDARWVFVAGDVRVDRGEDVRALDLAARLGRLTRLLSPVSHRPDLATDVCFLRAKQHFSVAQLRDVVERQVLADPPVLDYEVTGVTFRGTGPLADDAGDITFAVHRASATVPATFVAPIEAPVEASVEASVEAAVEAAEVDAEPEKVASFFIRRTDMPDVFELYDTFAQAQVGSPGAPIAGVPTLRASEVLRAAQRAAPDAPIAFAFSARFGKWVPTTEGL